MAKKKIGVILPSKNEKMATTKKTKKKSSVYSNLSYKRKNKKDAEARKHAEELAKLPKDPVKRFFARLHPKRVFKWWFSKRGQKAILKFFAACFLLCIIFIGGLFLYYKKDLDKISLDKIDTNISDTVNTYLDRNGEVLWKDTGTEDYRLVVDGSEISLYARQATVAIEDKNFYTHPGVDLTALVRATISTLSGKGVQGGSTLTQQLIKQVYFSDEAASANRGGLSRKIKELILSIELERMYDKEQIITMYLNQSPYGGRRNGIESASRTYFNKSAADLTLPEAALLAAIPNNPAVLNPYNIAGNEMLIERQHKVLDSMVAMNYITEEEANAAKEVAILDTIQPESNQYADMIAPHFVLEVKDQLEKKYKSAMSAGGWTITTTLDLRAQKIAEDAAEIGRQQSYRSNCDNLALVSVDVETSQIIAMVGSSDFYNVEYGELNVTTDSLIEPGSTIKPILDYAPLFMERDGMNYGPGTILKDENIDWLYCGGNTGSCTLTNGTNMWHGSISIRNSLAKSLNIAAVKALYINGIDNSLEIAHALGDKSYCENREGYGLSIAIGSGCGVKIVEHANAYATLARGGSYKDLAYVLEIKNASGDILETWTDVPAVRVVDEQIAYMLSDILSDRQARYNNIEGYVIPDVWTATKTGTTTTNNAAITKDSMMESYSTAVSTFVWTGNHDGSGLSSNTHDVTRFMVAEYMERVHKEVYEPDGRWHYGDQPVKPVGIQTLTVAGVTDIWPSWFDKKKNSGTITETLTFNKYNGLLASSCTKEEYKISVEVSKVTDPLTGNEKYIVPESYNREVEDTCDYDPPIVSISTSGKNIIAVVRSGSKSIVSYTLYINGVEYGGVSLSGDGIVQGYELTGKESEISLSVCDSAGYCASSGSLYLTVVDDNDDE